MQWLSENWIWILLAIGIFLFMRHGRPGHGHSYGGGHHGSHHGSTGHGELERRPKDPVSGENVDPAAAPNTSYRGRVYYFASRANRDAFEADPARYASPGDGHDDGHRRHRHGC